MAGKRQRILRRISFERILRNKVAFPFPQDHEARFRSALSCLNTELKQALLLELEFYPRTYVEIGKLLTEDTNTRLPETESFASYLTDSIVPAGFAVEERLGRGLGLIRRYYGLSRMGF